MFFSAERALRLLAARVDLVGSAFANDLSFSFPFLHRFCESECALYRDKINARKEAVQAQSFITEREPLCSIDVVLSHSDSA
jgi:hypothetical protein